MLKTSKTYAWTCVGNPPPPPPQPQMPVTDMPTALVDGTLYWVGEETQATAPSQRVVIVEFGISTRAFGILPCEHAIPEQ